MREAVGVDEFVDGGEDVLVAGDVVEGYGSVFFDPGLRLETDWELYRAVATNHGKLSSASTGRFAVLRLPLVASEEKITSLDVAGASTSISSSKSDMVSDLYVLLMNCRVLVIRQ